MKRARISKHLVVNCGGNCDACNYCDVCNQNPDAPELEYCDIDVNGNDIEETRKKVKAF